MTGLTGTRGQRGVVPTHEIVFEGDIRSPLRAARHSLARHPLRRPLSVLTLIAIDVVAVLCAAGLSWALHGLLDPDGLPAQLLLAAVPATLAAAALLGLYGLRRHRRTTWRLIAWPATVFCILALPALAIGASLPLTLLLLFTAAGALLAVVLRFLYDRLITRVLGTHPDIRSVVAIGDPQLAEELLDDLNGRSGRATHSLAAVLPLEDLEQAERLLELERPDIVVVAAELDPERRDVDGLLHAARRQGVQLLLCSPALSDEPVCHLPGLERPLFAVRTSHVRRRRFLIKRALDVTVAGVLLVVLSPLLLAVALAVKLTSPGPVIYVSWRVGAGQKAFPCLKFRTMTADADRRQAEFEQFNEADGCLFKMRQDPRVTRVGAWLRRTSIDELPQLANVVAGQMSLVGPRPLPLRDVRLLRQPDLHRHLVLPGITGLWQISGRSSLTADEMLALDREYISTWSLHGDLAILAGTLGAVVTRRGAY